MAAPVGPRDAGDAPLPAPPVLPASLPSASARTTPPDPLRLARRCLDAQPSWRSTLLSSALLALLLTAYLWSANLSAKFGELDDHQVAYWMGTAKQLTLSQAWHQLRISEAGEVGLHQRYRPLYFVFRLTEAIFYGPNPQAWYGLRLLLFALCAFVLATLSARVFGLLPGLALSALVWTAAYWGGIWAMLGPAETYACVGCCLALAGAYGLLRGLGSSAPLSPAGITASCWLFTIGALIAVGCKENFAAVALPATLALGLLAWRRQLCLARLLPLLVTVAFSVFVLYVVWLGTRNSGTDIYQQSVGLSRIRSLDLLWQGPYSFGSLLLFTLLFALLVSAIVRFRPADGRNIWATLATPLLSVPLLLALYAFQLVFYSGQWDRLSRYALPGELLYWGGWLALAHALLLTLHHFSPLLARLAKLLSLAALLALIAHFGYTANRTYAANNALRTTRLQAAVARATNALKAAAPTSTDHPAAPLAPQPQALLVLHTNTLNDYERLFALKAYLDAEGLAGRIVLELAEPLATQDWPPALAATILPDLRNAAAGTHYNGFSCLRLDATPARPCFRLIVNGAPPPDRCTSLGSVND